MTLRWERIFEVYTDATQESVTSSVLATIPTDRSSTTPTVLTSAVAVADSPDWAPNERIAFTRSESFDQRPDALGGTFKGGEGRDFASDVQGTFVAGPGGDSTDNLWSGTVIGGVGPDLVYHMQGGSFVGGSGADMVWKALAGAFEGGEHRDTVSWMYGGTFDGGPGWDRIRECVDIPPPSSSGWSSCRTCPVRRADARSRVSRTTVGTVPVTSARPSHCQWGARSVIGPA